MNLLYQILIPVILHNFSTSVGVSARTLDLPIEMIWSRCPMGYTHLADNLDCHVFYHCIESAWGTVLIPKTCGAFLMFNPEFQVCDWPSRVKRIRLECRLQPDLKLDARPRGSPSSPQRVSLPRMDASERALATATKKTITPLVNGKFSLDSMSVYTASNRTSLKPDKAAARSGSRWVNIKVLTPRNGKEDQ